MTEESRIEKQEENLDLAPHFRGVAEKYGRPMFALVMNAGLCTQATEVLANFAEKHRSRGSLHAVGVLSEGFNQISTAYCKQMGWTQEMLAQCDRDIMLAFNGKLIAPTNKLVLDS